MARDVQLVPRLQQEVASHEDIASRIKEGVSRAPEIAPASEHPEGIPARGNAELPRCVVGSAARPMTEPPQACSGKLSDSKP